MSDVLTYSHYCELIWFDDINKIQYYINLVEKYNLSVRELRNRIKSNEYERLPEDTKKKLDSNTKSSLVDLVKDPIIIKKQYYCFFFLLNN